MAAVSFEPIALPDLSAVDSTDPNAFATPGATFDVSGTIDRYAVASSIAMMSS